MVYVLTYQPLTAKIKAKTYEADENIEIRRVNWFGRNLFHRLEPYPVLEFLYLSPCLFIFTFFFLLKYQRRIEFIHAQGLNAAFITWLLAKAFRKKALTSTCAVYNMDGKSIFSRITKRVLSGMDKVLALGDYSKRELLRIGIPAAKLDTYHLWVDQKRYLPTDKQTAKEKINLKGKFIVLFVGRFIRIKGVEMLVEVAKTIDRKINFVFIGDNSHLLNYLENESRQQENIILIKGISGPQLIPYYQAADILAVPSQYEEAFGKVIIEALSCGTPVIGSNRGAIADIVKEPVGRIAEPTAENIRREIEYLYNNPEVLAELTRNCRVYAEQNFSERNAEVITKNYYA